MNKHVITTPNGERFVMLSEADFEMLLEAAEDAEDVAAARDFDQKIAAGEEELIPSAIVDRLLSGTETKVRVWREHRGLSVRDLAQASGVETSVLEAIEAGAAIDTDAGERIAEALRIDAEDLG